MVLLMNGQSVEAVGMEEAEELVVDDAGEELDTGGFVVGLAVEVGMLEL